MAVRGKKGHCRRMSVTGETPLNNEKRKDNYVTY